MKRNLSEKMLAQKQKSKNTESQGEKKKRFLITVNILGSAGPIRFVVNEEDNVLVVIDSALKLYAREGRLPVLGTDVGKFLLYPANAGSEALNPTESIGSFGGRNFVLCKNQSQPQMSESRSANAMNVRKQSGKLKAWLNKSLSFKILSN